MKLPTSLITVVLLTTLLFSCSKESLTEEEYVTENFALEITSVQNEVIDLVNDYRQEHNLSTLSYLSPIKDEASHHTDYMIEHGEVSHDFFFQRESNLVTKVGAVDVGENVAYGFSTSEGVVNAWVGSDKHRLNIEGDFTHVGVSAKKNEGGRIYYTMIFVKK